MPIRDWTRVRANRFHDFHQSWTIAIRNALNAGRLPRDYFAMVEQKTGGPEPDVIALEAVPPEGSETGGVAVDLHPPRTRIVTRTEKEVYAQKANRISIHHPDGRVVAVIEIVSPGNKESRHALDAFAAKAVEFLRSGVNLLVVDLFPPGPRDPHGIHKVIWDFFTEEPYEPPPGKPLVLASYVDAAERTAYVEPVGAGEPLPEMPVFLSAGRYVPCPLEETYQTAWEQFPAPLKGLLKVPAR